MGVHLIVQVQCTGTEADLRLCRHSARHDCSEQEAAGAVCDSATEQELEEEQQLQDSCYSRGLSYSPTDRIRGDTITATAVRCQNLCALDPDCLQFTHSKTTKTCRIYSASNSVVDSDDITGGPVACPSSVEEVEDCEGPLCLVGGRTPLEGNVYLDGRPICSAGWGLEEAKVTCRQLNFTGAQHYTRHSTFGLVTLPYGGGVQCEGGEEDLGTCTSSPGARCDSGQAAGVSCDNRSQEVIHREDTCFTRGLAYQGHRTHSLLVQPSTESAEACRKVCQGGASGCTHFTWSFMGGKCQVFSFRDLPGQMSHTSLACSCNL